MPRQIPCIALQHINFATRDFEESMRHFQTVWGAQFVHDMPADEWHAVLLYIGGVLFEMFVPEQYLLHGRYGPHWVGLEYQVADLGETRSAWRERKVELIRDIGIAIHTDPQHTQGVAFEFYDHSFFDEPFAWREPLQPPRYWEHEHPLGIQGLARYSVAVADLSAARAFYQDTFAAQVRYEEVRPHIAAQATGIDLAGTVVELLSPLGDGALARHLARYGDGMRSVVFNVRDLDRAAVHLESHGIQLAAGDAPGAAAIPAEANRGIMMELSE